MPLDYNTVANAAGTFASPSKPPPPAVAAAAAAPDPSHPGPGPEALACRREFPLREAIDARAQRAAAAGASSSQQASQQGGSGGNPLRDIPALGTIIPVVLYPARSRSHPPPIRPLVCINRMGYTMILAAALLK